MDKNIVALVREDTITVEVKFFPDSFSVEQINTILGTTFNRNERIAEEVLQRLKAYTYVTTLKDLKPGDLCVVFVSGNPKVVEVQVVHDSLNIEPNSDRQYKWIAAKVDMSYAKQIQEENTLIESTVANAYKSSARNQFRNMLLGSVDEEAKAKLLSLTAKKGI